MSDGNGRHLDSAEKTVRDIRRATRRKFSADHLPGDIDEAHEAIPASCVLLAKG